MPSRPKPKQHTDQCAVCKVNPSKYRCPSCPIRYCSVPCYKQHKAADHPDLVQNEAGPSRPSPPVEAPKPTSGDATVIGTETETELLHREDYPDDIEQCIQLDDDNTRPEGRPPKRQKVDEKQPAEPLRALSALSWPPEPDEAIFTDPLRREDPKPLRHSELLRIAQSADLRHLLSSTSLPSVLRALDALPTPGARAAMLSRCLSIDPISLSSAQSASTHSANLLDQREGSPPPLEDLIRALARSAGGEDGGGETEIVETEKGFYIGRESQQGDGQRVWIGAEERQVMRVFAGLVCRAIDGGQGDAWGEGGLAWEV